MEMCSINRVLIKEHFYGKKHVENVYQSLVPETFLILLNSPKQPMHVRNSFENKKFWERSIKKPLESWLDFFLCTHSLFIGKVLKNKDLGLVTSLSLGYKTWLEKFFFSYLSFFISTNSKHFFLKGISIFRCCAMEIEKVIISTSHLVPPDILFLYCFGCIFWF